VRLTSLHFIAAAALAAAAFTPARAQHIHIAAGAESGLPGSKLFFSNGFLYDVNSYGGVTPACVYMSANDPFYPGLYQSSATFTALPATMWTGGPTPYAAEQGAHIEMTFLSVEGPKGGGISLWVENEEGTSKTLMFTMPSGTFGATHRINLSEGVDFPEYDPFGHIHGRRFTASKPGLYTVGVQLVDTSAFGLGGGPLHSPSDTNYFYFQAGLHINEMVKTNSTVSVRFGAQAFNNYYLDVATNLPAATWEPIDIIVGGNHSDLHWMSDHNATNNSRFYRIREVPQ